MLVKPGEIFEINPALLGSRLRLPHPAGKYITYPCGHEVRDAKQTRVGIVRQRQKSEEVDIDFLSQHRDCRQGGKQEPDLARDQEAAECNGYRQQHPETTAESVTCVHQQGDDGDVCEHLDAYLETIRRSSEAAYKLCQY